MNKASIWKIRIRKDYKEANNHIVIGEVLQETPTWVKIAGRTYHFGKMVNRISEIQQGDYSTRIIPWHRIEVINELPSEFDTGRAHLESQGERGVVLTDGTYECPIYRHFHVLTD